MMGTLTPYPPIAQSYAATSRVSRRHVGALRVLSEIFENQPWDLGLDVLALARWGSKRY